MRPNLYDTPSKGTEEVPLLSIRAAKDLRLAEIFAPCFTLILQLRSTQEYGDEAVLRSRILNLLDHAEREGRRSGFETEELRAAKFAIVAFIDEAIFSSDWSQKYSWLARPLQLQLYDRNDAGEEFFARLAQLLAQPAGWADVLEVYYLCMALGFKGRYQLHQQEQLRSLIEEAHAALSRINGAKSEVLSPHGKPKGHAMPTPQGLSVWLMVVVALVLALSVYLFARVTISGQAADTVRTIEQVTHTGATL